VRVGTDGLSCWFNRERCLHCQPLEVDLLLGGSAHLQELGVRPRPRREGPSLFTCHNSRCSYEITSLLTRKMEVATVSAVVRSEDTRCGVPRRVVGLENATHLNLTPRNEQPTASGESVVSKCRRESELDLGQLECLQRVGLPTVHDRSMNQDNMRQTAWRAGIAHGWRR
jgi:hypothetical protein